MEIVIKNFKIIHITLITFLSLTSLTNQSRANQCLLLFKTLHSDTQKNQSEPEGKPKIPRLFMAPVKKIASIEDLNLPKSFTSSIDVAHAAYEEVKLRSKIPLKESVNLHIDFLAEQLPYAIKLLDILPSSEMNRTYYIINSKGHKLLEVTDIKSAIQYLKDKSSLALNKKSVTSEFYSQIVIDILALHYVIFKNIDFKDFHDFETYRDRVLNQNHRPKFQFNDNINSGYSTFEISPLIRFLNKLIEVKDKIHLQTQAGYLLWPTFSSLHTDDYQDVHLGVKFIGVTLDKQLFFDGNESDFFGLAIHDITNHTLQQDMLSYRNQFSNFKQIFFKRLTLQSGIQLEILKKIWFLGTHEGSQSIFREYLMMQKNLLSIEKAMSNLESDLGASVIYRSKETNGYSILSKQLKDEKFFLSEASSKLKGLNQKDLDDEVSLAWKTFVKIFHESVIEHFNSEDFKS